MAKYKQKKHSGIAKKIKVRPGGTTKMNMPGTNHNSGKKPTKFNRKARKGITLSSGDAKRYKRVIS